jgi:hypothetical protein
MRSNDDVLDAERVAATVSGNGLAPWQLEVLVEDDALEPVLRGGQKVVVDCSDHALEGGGIYAVRDGDRLELWLYQPGFAGLGCRFAGQNIGTLVALGGSFRLRGPLPVEAIRLIGRVVEPGAERSGALADLRQQQARLLALRETTRAALLQRAGTATHERPWTAASTVAAVADGLAASLRNRAFADRFALEQRLDAVDARLAFLDELIASLPARGLGDALTKLETLAALEPVGADDLQTRLLHSAVAALQRLAGEARRPGRDTGKPATGGGDDAEPTEPPAQPLELVASPRRRR